MDVNFPSQKIKYFAYIINMFNKILIHKDNLINNIKQVKFENPNSKICAMVKANAYGVGLKEVVSILDNYVDFFGVACFFEAKKVKKLTNKKILIVGPIEKNYIDENFSYTCSSFEDVKNLILQKKQINIHLKINTGMNRYGFKNIKEFKKTLNLILHSGLVVEGIFTHFATTDEYVKVQMGVFNKFIKVCKSFGFNPIIHADNSYVNEKHNHGLDMVRIGFNLYNRDEGWFLPVVEIKSAIVQINYVKKGELVGYNYNCVAYKNLTVAVVPLGYADGFDKKYINMNLNVKGENCKVLNICMDCFMLDVTNVKIKKGDEIYLVNKYNSLKKFAEYLSTSEYEVMTKFSYSRAKRIII